MIKEENRKASIPLPFRQDELGKKIKERLEAIEELEKLDFSYLGECLNRFESLSQRSCFFECLPLEVDKSSLQQLKSVVQLKPTSDDFRLAAEKCEVVMQLDTSETLKSTLSVVSGNYFLCEKVSVQIKSKPENVNVSIYHPTDAWDAVRFLRDKRNSVVGHPSSTNLTDAALNDLFTVVMEAYKKLPWISEDDYMEEVEEIKTGMSIIILLLISTNVVFA